MLHSTATFLLARYSVVFQDFGQYSVSVLLKPFILSSSPSMQLVGLVDYPLPILPRPLVYMEPSTTCQTSSTNVPVIDGVYALVFPIYNLRTYYPPFGRYHQLWTGVGRTCLDERDFSHGGYEDIPLYMICIMLFLWNPNVPFYFFQRANYIYILGP